jgi:hypothetical protein
VDNKELIRGIPAGIDEPVPQRIVWVKSPQHRRLKAWAAVRGMSMTDAVSFIIDKYIDSNNTI